MTLRFPLHSSMDRFKAFGATHLLWTKKGLYIPVWIDLKPIAATAVATFKALYIPVWIDLKDDNTLTDSGVKPSLHSSMDRFKAPSLQQK